MFSIQTQGLLPLKQHKLHTSKSAVFAFVVLLETLLALALLWV